MLLTVYTKFRTPSHRQIHGLLTETELAKTYNHVEALLAHLGIARFVACVKAKPDNFYERTRKSERIRD